MLEETYSYAAHNEAMRVVEAELQAERFKHITDTVESNDRRYEAVSIEKEKALKIKETADLAALQLARESQTYKEARNDAMREQNLKETGVYATRTDLSNAIEEIRNALKPLADYITGQQGGAQVGRTTKDTGFKIIAAISSILAILGVLAAVVMAVMK